MMRVFMLGWEFPPFISGGLGTACFGLTRALSSAGHDVLFVLPRPISQSFNTHVQLKTPKPGSTLGITGTTNSPDEFERVTFHAVESNLYNPYDSASEHARRTNARIEHERDMDYVRPLDVESADARRRSLYGSNLFEEVQRYANLATEVAENERFDVIHAHDWMTFPAALAVSARRGVPLVVHIHSTEFDRSGENVDQRIYDIERRGMHGAIKIIAVSHLTKNQIVQRYDIDPAKIDVVYNAIDTTGLPFDEEKLQIEKHEKIVLFLGRITHQKGPEYFLAAAKKVLEVMDNVKFIMAGSGDMIRQTIELATQLGIGHRVLFTGFLRGGDVEKVFKMADLYVMPSVSEPFGIAPLEAMSHDVPVIISKQSGVSEVLTHALKVDFWDTPEMANKIIAVLKHPPLANTLREHGSFEVRRLSWTDSANACVNVYQQMLKMTGRG